MSNKEIKTANRGIKERELIQFHHKRTEPITWGYMRVSTKEQNLDRQEGALINAGVNPEFIISDKASGKNFERTGYTQLKKFLKAGDTLVIKELDRLGRDKELIKEEWQDLKNKGIDIIVIDQPILNTAGKDDLTKELISNIVFELLTYMAESERLKIKSRQKEGIEKALEKGVKFGRPKTAKKEEAKKTAIDLYLNTNYSVAKILEMAGGISRRTFYNALAEEGIKTRK